MSNVKDAMADIETLGLGKNSVILSIGAVKFTAGGLFEEFHEYIDPDSCLNVGMEIDPSTVIWWMQQNEQARAQFNRPRRLLQHVLQDFREWLGDDCRIWGNGADMDVALLENAYNRCKVRTPWRYNHVRCYRTMKCLVPFAYVPQEEGEVEHNALHDAKSQARHLIEIMKTANLELQ